jgi:hypothetical protein
MNPMDIEWLINHWTDLGFTPSIEKDGQKVWKDICVFQGILGGATLPCDWIAYDRNTRTAYLKGTEVGEIKGREIY